MMTPLQRAAVVAEAISWERTPYHHRAAVKGAGADCALFPLAVYQACGVLPQALVPLYQQQWHLHRSEEVYLQSVLNLGAVEIFTEPEPGDFCLWKIGRCFSHGAIVIDWPNIVHAEVSNGVYRADALTDSLLARRVMKAFTL